MNKRIVKYEATVTSNGVTVKVTDLAGKLIDFALTVKGIDKPLTISKLIILKEKLGQYKETKRCIAKLKSIVLNDDYQMFIDKAEARIKAKKKVGGKKN